MAQVPAEPVELMNNESSDPSKSGEKNDAPIAATFSSNSCSTHSVLDAQLEALALGKDMAALSYNCEISRYFEGAERAERDTLESNFTAYKSKGGPGSLPGTGSSVASASDHSEVSGSDFESDSGIENSHAENQSPELGVTLLSKKQTRGKGVGPYIEVMPHDDLAVTATGGAGDNQLEEGSSDIRIDSFIQCLDNKVDRESLTEEALELLRLIPNGYIPLPHQVGGHRHVDGKLGFLRRVGQRDIVLKPVPAQKGPREVLFYKSVFGSHFGDVSKDLIVLKELVPKYYGTHDIVDRAGQIHKFIKLEDIVSRFHKPCIMDVKMGRRVWDDFAHQDKIDREKKKYPQQEVLGFRIIGMRVYRSATDDYIYYDKEYGRSVSVTGALDALDKFFNDGETERNDVIGPIVERLYYFVHWLEEQKLFKLFATSLIIVYEGDTKRPIRKPKDLLDIRLVDFAHAYERSKDDGYEPDYNTLFGLRNLIKNLERLNGMGKY